MRYDNFWSTVAQIGGGTYRVWYFNRPVTGSDTDLRMHVTGCVAFGELLPGRFLFGLLVVAGFRAWYFNRPETGSDTDLSYEVDRGAG